MKKLITYSITLSLCLCASAQASIIIADNFNDNSINSAIWATQVVTKDSIDSQDISFAESSQRLNLFIDSPPDIPNQSTIRQSLLTNVSASVSWSATVNITNSIDITMLPSVRIGMTVSDSTLSNFGGIYLKADDEARRLQDADFADIPPPPIADNGTIRLNYDHLSQSLTVGYALGIGTPVVDYQTIDTSTWDDTATNGFRFHLQGTVASTPPGLGDAYFDNFSVQSVPEPSSATLIGLGTLTLLRRKRFHKKNT